MKSNSNICQLLAWEPLPIKKSGSEFTSRKEGKTLPNSVTEDVGGFSLMPTYSKKQLRGMNRRLSASQRTKSKKYGWRMVTRW